MAAAFLRQLPRIPDSELAEDAACPICTQPYENQTTDSGSFEKAVRLPCNDTHILGAECLSEWLRHGKTCPLCRHAFVFPDDADRRRQERRALEGIDFFLVHELHRSQDWDQYWHDTFWILRLRGDQVVERKWHERRQEWIRAANHWDRGSQARARAALAAFQLLSGQGIDDMSQVRVTAAAIQTLRFREHRLYLQLQLQLDGAERPELNAPPGFQLTPAQEDAVFRELERREAFDFAPASVTTNTMDRRELWNRLRDVGFVWDPDCAIFQDRRRGRWSRYWC